MAYLDAEPQATAQERIAVLEAEVTVLRSYLRLALSLNELTRGNTTAIADVARELNSTSDPLVQAAVKRLDPIQLRLTGQRRP